MGGSSQFRLELVTVNKYESNLSKNTQLYYFQIKWFETFGIQICEAQVKGTLKSVHERKT